MSTSEMTGIENLRAYLRDDKNHDLYVINKSHLNGKRKRSECALTVKSEGQNVHIVIKDTFIPQNIGLKVGSLACFAQSEAFSNFVSTGFLEPVDPESAYRYLQTREARDELMRVSDIEGGGAEAPIGPSLASARKIDASPKVVSVMMNDSMDTSKKISALKNIASEISNDDIKFIVTNAKDERIKNWALNFTK